jgi:osmotically-inducible protein OsmY
MNTNRTTPRVALCALMLVLPACNKPALQSSAGSAATWAGQADQLPRSSTSVTEPLKEKVAAALNGEPGLAAVSVEVNADGTVMLNGTTNNQENKTKASQIALNVPGVQSVQNNLVVKGVA